MLLMLLSPKNANYLFYCLETNHVYWIFAMLNINCDISNWFINDCL